MIYLDTHAVIWLYQKDRDRFTPEALDLLGIDALPHRAHSERRQRERHRHDEHTPPQ